MVEAVNAFGSGVAGLSVLCPPAHFTHVCPLYWLFISSRRPSSSPHELLNTHELQNCILPVVCASTDKNGAIFPHAGPPLSVLFLAGSDCLPTHRYCSVWVVFPIVRAVLTVLLGLLFPHVLLAVVFTHVLGCY